MLYLRGLSLIAGFLPGTRGKKLIRNLSAHLFTYLISVGAVRQRVGDFPATINGIEGTCDFIAQLSVSLKTCDPIVRKVR